MIPRFRTYVLFLKNFLYFLYKDLVDALDYEVGLGLILSRDAKNVTAEKAEKYIFGYTNLPRYYRVAGLNQ
ncbi:fumarylacetoacetate hydrolase family protein [Clostridiaceae bacterium WCA-383-APC-5B]|uniref:Fumarylacetoacetate hydrolase family protein n=1 Tax=Inconstantimicrobium porci TaxID=2652291 RepID=A0A7X2N0X3_9CLOT|nr:fumarylacetoacetate hydrolase family protein [Inconstantimicrobium porci]